MPKMAMISLMSAGVISLATASYFLGRYGRRRALRGRRSGRGVQGMRRKDHADGRATPSWFARFRRAGKSAQNGPPSSGNLAFDQYRADTLKRLEVEQEEFSKFLEKLRRMKDAQDFEDFNRR